MRAATWQDVAEAAGIGLFLAPRSFHISFHKSRLGPGDLLPVMTPAALEIVPMSNDLTVPLPPSAQN